jgi:hypothetical protein
MDFPLNGKHLIGNGLMMKFLNERWILCMLQGNRMLLNRGYGIHVTHFLKVGAASEIMSFTHV